MYGVTSASPFLFDEVGYEGDRLATHDRLRLESVTLSVLIANVSDSLPCHGSSCMGIIAHSFARVRAMSYFWSITSFEVTSSALSAGTIPLASRTVLMKILMPSMMAISNDCDFDWLFMALDSGHRTFRGERGRPVRGLVR